MSSDERTEFDLEAIRRARQAGGKPGDDTPATPVVQSERTVLDPRPPAVDAESQIPATDTQETYKNTPLRFNTC